MFYSIHSLPPFWQAVSQLNPFFYVIDGFRYGFFGQSDVLAVDEPRDCDRPPSLPYHGSPCTCCARGYKLRH